MNSPLVNALPDLLSSLDPTGTLQRGLMTQSFSAPAFLARQFLSLQPGALATQSAQAFGTALTLPAAIGRPASDVQKRARPKRAQRDCASRAPADAPVPSAAGLLGLPLSGAPQNVILYTRDGIVVGVGSASAADAVAAKDAQILDLQKQPGPQSAMMSPC